MLLKHYPTLHKFQPLSRTEAIEYYGKSPGIVNKDLYFMHPWNPMHLETEYQGTINKNKQYVYNKGNNGLVDQVNMSPSIKTTTLILITLITLIIFIIYYS
jgi:hypothetical protein